MDRHSSHPGHGLRWDARTSRWWWSSTSAAALHAFSPRDQTTLTCRLPDGAGMVAHCKSGNLLIGLPKRLCVASAPRHSEGQSRLRVRALVAVDAAEPRTSITDGCTDRRGFLVFGTGNASSDKRPIGSFYQYSVKYGLRRLALPSVAQASSICLSNDGRRLYFADAAIGRILRCDYDAELAMVANIATFAELGNIPKPRGAVVDAAGCLWSAQPGQLVQYDPDGKAVRRIALDCGTPAFGGAYLGQLMVAGPSGLVAIPTPLVAGQPDALFDDHE